MKLNLHIPKKRTTREKSPATHSQMPADNLAARLAELHREHKGIGVILFGIRYARQIEDSQDTVKEIVRLSGVPESYDSEVYKGIKLAAHVSVFGGDE